MNKELKPGINSNGRFLARLTGQIESGKFHNKYIQKNMPCNVLFVNYEVSPQGDLKSATVKIEKQDGTFTTPVRVYNPIIGEYRFNPKHFELDTVRRIEALERKLDGKLEALERKLDDKIGEIK